MSFDPDHNPAYKVLTHATDLGMCLMALGAIYGLIFAQRQIRRGEERLGRISRKQALLFFCIPTGYLLLRLFAHA